MTLTLAQLAARPRHGRRRRDNYQHLVDQHRVGPVDALSAGDILALLPQLPDWLTGRPSRRSGTLRGAENILAWLEDIATADHLGRRVAAQAAVYAAGQAAVAV
ncbi:hypothetical protein ADK70_27185 [Streptomyces rimosus subsp. pseudoverticillatus]|uniref:hypothetical protein n=1 Tax=Streptomyces rimosus TaxID=1927 RepID=UPI0006B27F3B|nr:hypothetical protein [Streptomyces rimosus]KOT80930.1 hypothetical protein ADK70_27185 [Streptomyces rimosus subsp. pseudoverticillatus]